MEGLTTINVKANVILLGTSLKRVTTLKNKVCMALALGKVEGIPGLGWSSLQARLWLLVGEFGYFLRRVKALGGSEGPLLCKFL